MLADKRLFLIGIFGFLFLFFTSKATPGNAAPFYEGKTLALAGVPSLRGQIGG